MSPPRVSLLSPELQRQVQAELRPGERQPWAAQPLPRLFRLQSIGLVLFGVPRTAFSVFWTVAAGWGVGHHHAGQAVGPFIAFPLFGLQFARSGGGMLASPFWLGRKAARTVYAVTDFRAFALTGKTFGGVTVHSVERDRLTSITRNQRTEGSGDLVCEQFTERRGSGTSTVRRGFMGTEHVRDIEDLIYAKLLAGRTRTA